MSQPAYVGSPALYTQLPGGYVPRVLRSPRGTIVSLWHEGAAETIAVYQNQWGVVCGTVLHADPLLHVASRMIRDGYEDITPTNEP
jgi:hypothetical protein